MRYEISATEIFDKWIAAQDGTIKRRLANRLLRVECGHFGDHKQIAVNLFELRCFFGGGLRLYYTLRHGQVVLLLVGGSKSTQPRDIARATIMMNELDE